MSNYQWSADRRSEAGAWARYYFNIETKLIEGSVSGDFCPFNASLQSGFLGEYTEKWAAQQAVESAVGRRDRGGRAPALTHEANECLEQHNEAPAEDDVGLAVGGRGGVPGDRVRAEILASDPIVAYAAIADAQGKLLVPAEQIHASAQRLSAGERKAFPGSFKLVGPAEGETLVILICEKETLATGLLEQVRTREESILTRNQLPKGCDMQLFPLR